jgi:hypothetical protein
MHARIMDGALGFTHRPRSCFKISVSRTSYSCPKSEVAVCKRKKSGRAFAWHVIARTWRNEQRGVALTTGTTPIGAWNL